MDVNHVFSYHPPTAGQPEKYEAIRSAAKTLAQTIIDNTPVGIDRNTAIQKLRECVMMANASIALDGRLG